MKKGLDYKFKLNDLTKYSRWLKPSDSDNKFERSALGKIVPEVSARRLRQKCLAKHPSLQETWINLF